MHDPECEQHRRGFSDRDKNDHIRNLRIRKEAHEVIIGELRGIMKRTAEIVLAGKTDFFRGTLKFVYGRDFQILIKHELPFPGNRVVEKIFTRSEKIKAIRSVIAVLQHFLGIRCEGADSHNPVSVLTKYENSVVFEISGNQKIIFSEIHFVLGGIRINQIIFFGIFNSDDIAYGDHLAHRLIFRYIQQVPNVSGMQNIGNPVGSRNHPARRIENIDTVHIDQLFELLHHFTVVFDGLVRNELGADAGKCLIQPLPDSGSEAVFVICLRNLYAGIHQRLFHIRAVPVDNGIVYGVRHDEKKPCQQENLEDSVNNLFLLHEWNFLLLIYQKKRQHRVPL